MDSTNKTDNLNLSQFVALDKPSWLTDYNNDMEKIDAAVSAAKATATAAGITGVLPVANGGTGNTTGTANNIKPVSSTTGPIQFLTGGGNYQWRIATSGSNNFLTIKIEQQAGKASPE